MADREPTADQGEPPPYGYIRDLFNQGKIIPFLGAGVHLSNRPPEASYAGFGEADFLPSGAELANVFALDSGFPAPNFWDKDDLPKVASYCQTRLGRDYLSERLRAVFNKPYSFQPNDDIHEFIASNPVPLLVVTTNYDDLMERALDQAGKPYVVVINPADGIDHKNTVLVWRSGESEPTEEQPGDWQIDLKSTWVIYKMHGTVLADYDKRVAALREAGKTPEAYDTFVITEEDYVEFLTRMTERHAIPSVFMRSFAQGRFLFLGYGLRDWNFRVVLHNLRKNLKKNWATQNDKKSWAIQPKPSRLERQLWDARGIEILPMRIDQFVRELKAAR